MSRPQHTLLLVEDSPEDRHTYRAFLSEDREAEYVFLEEEDAERALEVCQQREVDCILLDYHLPGLNGLEFLRRLKSQRSRTTPPVVMLTGRGSEQVATQALKSGAADYLVKSDVTPDSLFRAVRNTLERERLRRELEAREEDNRRLMAEQQQMAAVVANSSAFVSFATSEGQLLYINEAGRRMVGLGLREDVSRLRMVDLFAPGDVTWHESHIEPALWTQGRWRGEFRLRHLGTGTLIPVQHDAFLIPGAGAVLTVLGAISQDISDLKRQEQVSRQRADFEQYLAGIVGHDLRNPVNAISLAAEQVLRRSDLDEPLRRTMSRIQTSAERMNRMIDTTLDFTQARLGSGLRMVRKPVDLHLVIQRVVGEVQLAWPERRIEVMHVGDGTGEWDADRLAQVLTNLLTNALKYSPAGTPVKVRAEGEPESFLLEVHNLGEPIPRELLPRLFLPMKRGEAEAERSERSLGLGLFIVDHIVGAHGGRIDVQSDREQGTRFTVRLPRRSGLRGLALSSPGGR
ncbi:MAG TPA: hybrid sensor histidine kinase/response regulator [Myxococcaceae bacterium]|jgi:PAS domain S-box-containing protein